MVGGGPDPGLGRVLIRTAVDTWQRYLHEEHPPATLRAWARRLHRFRFVRASGGHANDGDSLEAAFACAGGDELRAFCATLGIPLVEYDTEPPQPEVGKAYPADEFERFVSLIPGTRWWRQPGHCTIAGQPVFVWCRRDRIDLSIGRDYRVTEADVCAAEAIEVALAQVTLPVIDPPADRRHCICPKYHPDVFA